MTQKAAVQSEGALLEETIADLEREHNLRSISGWETGFARLSGVIDGLLPGLYVVVGAPGFGKTALAKQLLDQVVKENRVAGIYFGFAEPSKELRIKTLARLSEIDASEIRRGSAYLLHWYGVPKAHAGRTEELSPSWDKVRKLAEEAKPWLDRVYLVECHRGDDLRRIANDIGELQALGHRRNLVAVIDDCQRLGASGAVEGGAQIIAEQLQQTASDLAIPMIAVWPDLRTGGETPEVWRERFLGADAVMVLTGDAERSKKAPEHHQAVTIHVVKNRRGEKAKLNFDFMPAFSKFVEV